MILFRNGCLGRLFRERERNNVFSCLEIRLSPAVSWRKKARTGADGELVEHKILYGVSTAARGKLRYLVKGSMPHVHIWGSQSDFSTRFTFSSSMFSVIFLPKIQPKEKRLAQFGNQTFCCTSMCVLRIECNVFTLFTFTCNEADF